MHATNMRGIEAQLPAESWWRRVGGRVLPSWPGAAALAAWKLMKCGGQASRGNKSRQAGCCRLRAASHLLTGPGSVRASNKSSTWCEGLPNHAMDSDGEARQVVLAADVSQPPGQTPGQQDRAVRAFRESLGDVTEVLFAHNNYLLSSSADLLRSVVSACKNLVKLVRFAAPSRRPVDLPGVLPALHPLMRPCPTRIWRTMACHPWNCTRRQVLASGIRRLLGQSCLSSQWSTFTATRLAVLRMSRHS